MCKIELTKEQLKEIKEQMPHIFEKKRWKPENGESYYYINYWEDKIRSRYTVFYDYYDKKFGIKFRGTIKSYSPIGYLKSREACEQLIKDCELDLGISGVGSNEVDICSWNTTAEVDKKYIDKMTKKLKEAYEHNGATDIKITALT